MRFNQIEQTIVRRLVLRQFPRIWDTDGLSAPRRHAARSVRDVAAVVVEVEQARRETHGQVRSGHLIVERVTRHVMEEVQKSLECLAVLVWQQQKHALHRVRAQLTRNVCFKSISSPRQYY